MAVVRKALAMLLCTFSVAAEAGDKLVQWTDTSLTALFGTNFKVTGDDATTLTFEHASGWSFGDLFMFVDVTDYHDNPVRGGSWYGEFSPRFSLKKVGLINLPDDGFLKDLTIATTWEKGKNGVEALLIGPGTSLAVPGFAFFQVNVYARKDTGKGAGFEDAQVTVSWRKRFSIGQQEFVIDGFADYVMGWGPQAANLHLVPQVKWDMGKAMGLGDHRLYLGSEIDIWTNKFGIPDSGAFPTDQLGLNLILKAHF
ncbi:outer membrane protein OmpK [Gimibacter soli]|uniref:Outer membrane protein OmpK n=1 Tax=Gimibacter soli TaxID=3024400 RepID=A0AAF0BMY7_9PROT|nr:outer membrane protein OmpK [Gimibacter soli]WCL55201.1 outer membrane protein OmpK [Gimibacter soli]